MMKNNFDVIIVGGSYAGLSAAMALGRSVRNTLVIDSGKPCNAPTPHSHNFITQDGETPGAIAAKAKEQVLQYPTVRFVDALATKGRKAGDRFEIEVSDGTTFSSKKVLFATGVKDIMPSIEGFAACWGKSVIHCPYCHGYEVRNEVTGIISNGDMAFEYARLINHWTKSLTLFTNGPSELKQEHVEKIRSHNINIVETGIDRINHKNGYLTDVVLSDGKSVPLKAIYSRAAFVQHCTIPEELGCELTEQKLLKVDAMYHTTVPGLFAAGDNVFMMRSVSMAVATGGFAGAIINKELIEEAF